MSGIQGVILAGGRSSRMGRDKALLPLCGDDELHRIAAAMGEFCDDIYLSVREARTGGDGYGEFPLLIDPPGIGGPIAGLAAAFEADPGGTWLLTAVDMPYVGATELSLLTEAPRPGTEAVCFYNRALGGPEPLLALFTPEFYPRLRTFLDSGGRGLFRLMSGTPCTLINPPRESALRSMNTPDEYNYAKEAACDDD